MNIIFIKHHLGMGDHIVHNGMIRRIVKENEDSKILIASQKHNIKNVQYMFRDLSQITIIEVGGDREVNDLIHSIKFDKVISSHLDDRGAYSYSKYFDDAFYRQVGMDPKIKNQSYYIDRDLDLENRVFDEIITSKGITDYLFIHEKTIDTSLDDELGQPLFSTPSQLMSIRLDSTLPIISAGEKYGIFELLKVIEKAQAVHLTSSCFLSLMMCKKYNENITAHMYCDPTREYIAPYIKKHGINVLL